MRAVTWQGKRDVRVETVPDPILKEPNDAIIKVTSTGICGSDLHLYEVLGPFLEPGDILGHEPMGIVEEVGSEVSNLAPGDRVVVPFNISCGHCFMCDHGLQSQCETTQVHEYGSGRQLCSATPSCTGRCRAAKPSICACPRPSTGRSRCPRARPTTGSSTSPTCCPPRGRRSSTPMSRTAGASRARARTDRRHGDSGCPAPRRRADHRRRPRARATRAGARARGDHARPQRDRRPR